MDQPTKGEPIKRIFIPTAGPSEWRKFLADPEIQWQHKASAFELAVSWERAERSHRGIPPEIAHALDHEPLLSGSSLLLAVPEHKVWLKGRGRASQNDVWALLLCSSGYVSMTVEGKAGEPFGPTLGEWLKDASYGKRERLDFLCETLEIQSDPPMELRYQLLHRTASGILEARRFRAGIAVMMVQSFARDEAAWQDFARFAQILGAQAGHGRVVAAPYHSGSERLFLGWVDCTPASDSEIANTV